MGKGLLIILLFCGCYSQKKATVQHGRAVVTFPRIGIDYCAAQYPCDTVSTGSVVYVSDSAAFTAALEMVTEENALLNAIVDSLLRMEPPIATDTNCYKIIDVLQRQNATLAYRLAHIPAIHDTVRLPGVVVVDKAKLAACEYDKTQLIASIAPLNAEIKRFHKGRDTWRLIALISLAVNGLGLFFKLRKFIPRGQ